MFGVHNIFSHRRVISTINLKSVFLILNICDWALISAINDTKLDAKNLEYLKYVPDEDWRSYLDFGIEFVNKQKRLEENLVKAHIFVQNGSISHMQLLDALPNEEARKDNDIARKLLAASLYILNSKCLSHGIEGEECEKFLAMKTLPANCELINDCFKIIESRRNGHNSFRRLLPRFYQDGIYEMFTGDELILPMSLSKKMHCLSFNKNKQKLEDRERNLAVVQWAQFIEHDLSKPVVTSMGDGSHIECCNKNNFELGPRHRHPFCAPLIINSGESLYGKADCLNYVRSAVAVSTKCTFGAIEQLNLATSGLDLSQLYGFTHEAQKQMRLLQKGQIKSSANGSLSEIYTDKLPKINDNAIHYCAFENYSNQTGHCFMAGDSRVNNNPLTIVIYTMFMRNHNQVAKNLASSYPLWNDEDLFQTAKAINIHIYRNIVFDEWLPIILGEDTVVKIKQGSLSKAHEEDDRVSNEFAVAAIRFYISMLPNVLNNSTGAKRLEYNTTNSSFGLTRNILPSENVISLIDQTYKPKLEYTSKKIDALIESILNQPAMKLDTIYDDSLISENLSTNRPNHNDFLAYDIQRGRDHGLRSYINYLEFHTGKKISTWTHLEPFIAMEDLNKLKSIYNDLSKIDLLVGGMAETNSFGGIVGPTFKYILAEQFSRIYQKQESLKDQLLPDLTKVSAVDFVCANSGLQRVPRNIFLFVSDKNTQKSCIDQLNPIRA